MYNKIRQNLKYILVILDQAITSVSAFILTVLITRYTGIEGLGLFAISQAILMIASIIHMAFVVMPISTTYPVFEKKKLNINRDHYFFVAHYFVSIIVFLLFIFIFFLFLLLTNSSISSSFSLGVVFAVLPFLTFNYLRAIALARFNYVTMLIMSLSYALVAIFGLWFFELHQIDKIFYLFSGSWLIGCLLGGVFPNKILITYRDFKQILIRCWFEGRWLFGYRLITYFRGHLLIYFLVYFSGTSALGSFRIIQSLYGPMSMLLVSLESFLPQIGSKIYKYYGLRALIKTQSLVTFFITLILLIFSLILYSYYSIILDFIFSLAYLKIDNLIIAQSLVMIFVVFNTVFAIFIRIAGNSKTLSMTSGIELVVLIVPGILLISYFSTLGAIIWQGLSSVLNLLLLFYFFRYRHVSSN